MPRLVTLLGKAVDIAKRAGHLCGERPERKRRTSSSYNRPSSYQSEVVRHVNVVGRRHALYVVRHLPRPQSRSSRGQRVRRVHAVPETERRRRRPAPPLIEPVEGFLFTDASSVLYWALEALFDAAAHSLHAMGIGDSTLLCWFRLRRGASRTHRARRTCRTSGGDE